MSRGEWLSPGTKWRGVSPRELRRDSAIWLAWCLGWLAVWLVLGTLLFRFEVLPSDSALLLIVFFGALVLAAVSGLLAFVRFTLSFLLE